MDNVIYDLFELVLFPFTSGTDFVMLPCLMCCVMGLTAWVFRLIRGRY